MSVQYTRRCALHWGISLVQWDIINTLGMFSASGDIMISLEDIMINAGEGHWEATEFIWKPQCAKHPPPPMYSMISPNVLNIHPPMYCTDIMQGDFVIVNTALQKLLHSVNFVALYRPLKTLFLVLTASE